MCDRSRCQGTMPSGLQPTGINLSPAIELDYTQGCSHRDDLITTQPPCLDCAKWPTDQCNPAQAAANCRSNLVKVSNEVKKINRTNCNPPSVANKVSDIEWVTQMENNDKRKYHIPGYGGHVPRIQFGPKFGTYSLMTHQGLNEFSDAQKGICKAAECFCPVDPDFQGVRGKKPKVEPQCHIGCGMVPRCS